VNRAHSVLFAILLCSCTGPRGPGEDGKTAESERLRFLDRSDLLVEHTFEIMEVRAERSESREQQRTRGVRVCEEGENGTNWKEDCNTCRCEWGFRTCTNGYCMPPEESARLRAEAKRHARRQAERYREVRVMDRARGVRVCEEGEDGTIWEEGRNTCWCKSGIRYCSKFGGPPPSPTHRPRPPKEEFTFEQPPRDYREIYKSKGRRRCKEEDKGTSWQWGCNTCWCAGGFRVCSKADCASASEPLLEGMFETMEKRAQRSKQRELLRAEGRRVCEEGESRTRWEEDCKDCLCDWGVRFCGEEKTDCQEPSWTWTPVDWEEYEMAKAEQRSLWREIYRNQGERVCEEGEDGTRWREGCDTCWCEAGVRVCTTRCAPPISAPPSPD
jgi:hypothetical protein